MIQEVAAHLTLVVLQVQLVTNPRKAKQVIVWRADLLVRTGKFGAQIGHAVMGNFLALDKERREEEYSSISPAVYDSKKEFKFSYEEGSALDHWINERFPKIITKVRSEKELLDIYEKAKAAGLRVCLITDSGLTEFHGILTHTCIGIGPHWADEIDPITGHLELM